MTLYFEEEGEITLPLECETLAKKVVEEALEEEILLFEEIEPSKQLSDNL